MQESPSNFVTVHLDGGTFLFVMLLFRWPQLELDVHIAIAIASASGSWLKFRT